MKNTSIILNILKIFFWIFYISLVITIAALVLVFITTVFRIDTPTINHIKVSLPNFHGSFNQLKEIGKIKFFIIIFLAILFCILEACLISDVIKVLRKLNLNNPFSVEISKLIERITSLAIVLAILSTITKLFDDLLLNKDGSIKFELNGDGFNFLIFAGIIYIIGKIYKKGYELQSENDLTI